MNASIYIFTKVPLYLLNSTLTRYPRSHSFRYTGVLHYTAQFLREPHILRPITDLSPQNVSRVFQTTYIRTRRNAAY